MTRKLKIISLIILGVLLAAIAVTYGTAIPARPQRGMQAPAMKAPPGFEIPPPYNAPSAFPRYEKGTLEYDEQMIKIKRWTMEHLCGTWSGDYWTSMRLKNTITIKIWQEGGKLKGAFYTSDKRTGEVTFDIRIEAVFLKLHGPSGPSGDLLRGMLKGNEIYFQLNPTEYYPNDQGWGAGQLTRQK